jgi:hypothetical protein
VPQFDAPRLDHVVICLQVALDGLVAVDGDANLDAVPHEPHGDAGFGRLHLASVTLLLFTRLLAPPLQA